VPAVNVSYAEVIAMEKEVRKLSNYPMPTEELTFTSDCLNNRYIEKPGIEFSCVPNDLDLHHEAICDYKWEAEFVSNQTVQFKIIFDRPMDISQ